MECMTLLAWIANVVVAYLQTPQSVWLAASLASLATFVFYLRRGAQPILGKVLSACVFVVCVACAAATIVVWSEQITQHTDACYRSILKSKEVAWAQ